MYSAILLVLDALANKIKSNRIAFELLGNATIV